MTLHPPLWAQNNLYPAAQDRQVISVFDSGVVRLNELYVRQRAAGANFTVDVAAGRVVLPGPDGSYLCRSDAIENKAVAAAPAPTNSRIDKVVARLIDNQATGAGDPLIPASWVIEVITGTPAASNPATPATPSWSVALATILVSSSSVSVVDSMITDQRPLAMHPSPCVVEFEGTASIANGATGSLALTPIASRPTGHHTRFVTTDNTRVWIPWTGIYDMSAMGRNATGGGFGWALALQLAEGVAGAISTNQMIAWAGFAQPHIALAANGVYLTAGQTLLVRATNNIGSTQTFTLGNGTGPSGFGPLRLVYRGTP